MNTQKYLNCKYFDFYMHLATEASTQSVAVNAQVGACIVLPSGLISLGWNGTPAGQDNCCEDVNGRTKDNVIHAEMNALKKLLLAGESTKGAILFTTLAPCKECAVQLVNIGIERIYYKDKYKNDLGINLLMDAGVPVSQLI